MFGDSSSQPAGQDWEIKEFVISFWNTFGRIKSDDSCPYDHVHMNVLRNINGQL